jgi:hypothetical protein
MWTCTCVAPYQYAKSNCHQPTICAHGVGVTLLAAMGCACLSLLLSVYTCIHLVRHGYGDDTYSSGGLMDQCAYPCMYVSDGIARMGGEGKAREGRGGGLIPTYTRQLINPQLFPDRPNHSPAAGIALGGQNRAPSHSLIRKGTVSRVLCNPGNCVGRKAMCSAPCRRSQCKGTLNSDPERSHSGRDDNHVACDWQGSAAALKIPQGFGTQSASPELSWWTIPRTGASR